MFKSFSPPGFLDEVRRQMEAEIKKNDGVEVLSWTQLDRALEYGPINLKRGSKYWILKSGKTALARSNIKSKLIDLCSKRTKIIMERKNTCEPESMERQ